MVVLDKAMAMQSIDMENTKEGVLFETFNNMMEQVLPMIEEL